MKYFCLALPDSHQLLSTVIDTDEMKELNDDKLDHIVDTLLVQIVESLVDINSDESEDIRDELNELDKSGFCLLHYAALYNLQSLIPVLLSKGANPDVLTRSGNLTPLHLACSAGNAAIAELLLRHGCTEDVYDVFGMYPADHAERNGFKELADMLRARNPRENVNSMDVDMAKHDSDIKKYRLQQAFANLSLQDKMILNLLVGKQKRRGRDSKSRIDPVPEEELSEENDDEMIASNGVETQDRNQLASVIFDGNKETLDMAMNLMNEEVS